MSEMQDFAKSYQHGQSSLLFLSSAIQRGSHTVGYIRFGRKLHSQLIPVASLLIPVVGIVDVTMKRTYTNGSIFQAPFFM
jgi:hypothetical protein